MRREGREVREREKESVGKSSGYIKLYFEVRTDLCLLFVMEHEL